MGDGRRLKAREEVEIIGGGEERIGRREGELKKKRGK